MAGGVAALGDEDEDENDDDDDDEEGDDGRTIQDFLGRLLGFSSHYFGDSLVQMKFNIGINVLIEALIACSGIFPLPPGGEEFFVQIEKQGRI